MPIEIGSTLVDSGPTSAEIRPDLRPTPAKIRAKLKEDFAQIGGGFDKLGPLPIASGGHGRVTRAIWHRRRVAIVSSCAGSKLIDYCPRLCGRPLRLESPLEIGRNCPQDGRIHPNMWSTCSGARQRRPRFGRSHCNAKSKYGRAHSKSGSKFDRNGPPVASDGRLAAGTDLQFRASRRRRLKW